MLNLADLKSFFHLESEIEKEDRYRAILDRIYLLKAEQNELIEEHEEEKLIATAKLNNLSKVSIPEADELCKAINVKYNAYFSKFTDRLAEIKKDYNKEEGRLEKLFKDKTFEKAQQIKDEEFLQSFILIADLYSKNQISEETFQKVKNDVIKKGGYAIGTIRNWADGKYKKDIDKYSKEIWTKISDETSGSGASAAALRSEIEKTYDLFNLKKKIETIPEKYKDSPLAKMAKQIYDEKDKREIEYLSKLDIDRLKKDLDRIVTRSYYSEEKKAFSKERYEKIISIKESIDKMSPMEVEEKGIKIFEVGTIRDWADGKYIKEADGTWRKMPEMMKYDERMELEVGQEICIVEDDRISERILSDGIVSSLIMGGGDSGAENVVGIIVKDLDTDEETQIDYEDTERMNELKFYPESVKGFVRKKPSMLTFPSTIDKLKTTASLGGSSDVKLAKWMDKAFALKTSREDKGEDGKSQLRHEYIANAIYKVMGFEAPSGKVYESGKYLLNQFEEGKELGKMTYRDRTHEVNVKKELRNGYVLDCLLGNWDVIGANADNILVGPKGVMRIDNGGCFSFRAKGGKKDYKSEVSELETMKKQNPLWYGDFITNKDIKEQIERISKNKENILRTLEWEANQAGLVKYEITDLYNEVRDRINWLENNEKYKEPVVDKGEYESGVTNQYFKNWGEVSTGGLTNKEVIKQNIIDYERKNSSAYERYATSRGISVEEYKGLLQKKVEHLFSNMEFFRATDIEVLDKIILTDGRWKSQFETHTSDGTLSPPSRNRAEHEMFGTPDSISGDVKERAIYGYWTGNTNGVLNSSGENPPPNSMSGYGKVTFKVKPEVAYARATVTLGDSLGQTYLPVPASKPHFAMFNYGEDPLNNERYLPENICKRGWEYTETQFHGGLSMEDIESVHISLDNGLSAREITQVINYMMKYTLKDGKHIEVKYYQNK